MAVAPLEYSCPTTDTNASTSSKKIRFTNVWDIRPFEANAPIVSFVIKIGSTELAATAIELLRRQAQFSYSALDLWDVVDDLVIDSIHPLMLTNEYLTSNLQPVADSIEDSNILIEERYIAPPQSVKRVKLKLRMLGKTAPVLAGKSDPEVYTE